MAAVSEGRMFQRGDADSALTAARHDQLRSRADLEDALAEAERLRGEIVVRDERIAGAVSLLRQARYDCNLPTLEAAASQALKLLEGTR